jgi:peroxiredoxin
MKTAILLASMFFTAPALAMEAVVGEAAPNFELPDLDGKTVKLADLKGKTVVLEWFNPGCPFVVRAHSEKGSLATLAAEQSKTGVAWVAINSGAPGNQGHGVEANKEAAKSWNLSHPILLDETGAVGKAYGAKTTPNMFVINPEGVLVYSGAVDNNPSGNEVPKVKNYVTAALSALSEGKPVRTPRTKSYGCSVKY